MSGTIRGTRPHDVFDKTSRDDVNAMEMFMQNPEMARVHTKELGLSPRARKMIHCTDRAACFHDAFDCPKPAIFVCNFCTLAHCAEHVMTHINHNDANSKPFRSCFQCVPRFLAQYRRVNVGCAHCFRASFYKPCIYCHLPQICPYYDMSNCLNPETRFCMCDCGRSMRRDTERWAADVLQRPEQYAEPQPPQHEKDDTRVIRYAPLADISPHSSGDEEMS